MKTYFVNAEGGLTTAGYVAALFLVLLLVAVVFLLSRKTRETGKVNTRQLAICAACVALAWVTSYIKLFSFPFGGSVTLCSMLFIALVGYWYGTKTGIAVGLLYGILQFLQGPYVLSLFQVGCDYVLAFGAMGLSGLFSGAKKNGLVKGYMLAILARGAFHALGGYLYWMAYMPENFPTALQPVYPIVYNYAFILAEGVLTVVVLSIPAVKRGILQMTGFARG